MKKTAIFHKSQRFAVHRFGSKGYLTCADALAFMRSLNDEVADILFLDPPFNLGKNYGVKSDLENAKAKTYEAYFRRLIREAVRTLKPGGALFFYHLPSWASRLSSELNSSLSFRHWIAIAMKNSFVRGKNLYPAHYALLYYTKGTPAHFKRPRYQAKRCRKCGASIKDYGGYAQIIRRRGINLSDFWDDLSPVRHKNTKLRRANQLPLALTDRIVAIAGCKKGVLVDPFVGTGTSLISAVNAKMYFLGNDLSSRSLRICINRLTANSSPPNSKSTN